MHFAFTPEVVSSPRIPGAIARGSHFYCWSRLSDTLRCLWRLKLTQHETTNAEHPEIWSLLGRMLLDVSLDLESGSTDLPAAADIGALLVLILRHRELVFDATDDATPRSAMAMHVLRARRLLENVKVSHSGVYEAWVKEDRRLSSWIRNHNDAEPDPIGGFEALSLGP
jgi:hypothetical protein